MALISGLNTSISGLKMNQSHLDAVSRNIVNANTPGYSRKTYSQHNVVLDGRGAGVGLSQMQRHVDEGLLKSFLSANSLGGTIASENKYLNNIESVIGSPLGNNSLANNITNLHKAFENLNSNINSAASKYDLISSAKSFTDRINSLSISVQKSRAEADQEIASQVNQINSILEKLAVQNDDIVKYTALGYDGVPDLLDERDEYLKELSSYLDISYFTRESGEIVIQTVDGANLLDKEAHKLSHNAISKSSALTSVNGGGISGIYIDGVDITNKLKNGTIKGLINIRDNVMPSLQSQLDELSAKMADSINKEHNMGTSFPNLRDRLEGTANFVDSSLQQIKIENGDVRFTIFDSEGKQVSTAVLGADLGFTSGSIDTMTTALENWLKSPTGANLPNAKASVDGNGNFVIDTGDSEYCVSIMDVENATLGAKQTNVKVSFDANGDGVFDKTTEGFSNFFGLNDFFVNESKDTTYESKVINPNINLGLNSPSTLSFSDKTNGLNYASITINPGDNIQAIIDKINNDPQLSQNIKATLVPSGDGYVLRINNSTGEQLEITETSSTNLMNKLKLSNSSAMSSNNMTIREDLLSNPDLVSVGSPEYDKTSGEYWLSATSNTIANKLASAMTEPISFSQAGSLSATSSSLADYAATFVGIIASSASSSNQEAQYQFSLLESIQSKQDILSKVDVDEELANLIIFKQSYEACAQALNVAVEMMDILLSSVK